MYPHDFFSLLFLCIPPSVPCTSILPDMFSPVMTTNASTEVDLAFSLPASPLHPNTHQLKNLNIGSRNSNQR
jgi:hypothetical protein